MLVVKTADITLNFNIKQIKVLKNYYGTNRKEKLIDVIYTTQ